jgi:hypothetical protein
MTKAQLIKALAADLKESAARNMMKREGAHIVWVNSELTTAQYIAVAHAAVEYNDGEQVSVECHGVILTRKTGTTELIGNLIKNLLQ